jgi:hypothetical protein
MFNYQKSINARETAESEESQQGWRQGRKKKENIVQVAIPVNWEASGIEPDAGVEPISWMLESTYS